MIALLITCLVVYVVLCLFVALLRLLLGTLRWALFHAHMPLLGLLRLLFSVLARRRQMPTTRPRA